MATAVLRYLHGPRATQLATRRDGVQPKPTWCCPGSEVERWGNQLRRVPDGPHPAAGKGDPAAAGSTPSGRGNWRFAPAPLQPKPVGCLSVDLDSVTVCDGARDSWQRRFASSHPLQDTQRHPPRCLWCCRWCRRSEVLGLWGAALVSDELSSKLSPLQAWQARPRSLLYTVASSAPR